MDTSDIQIIIGQLFGSYAIGFAFGFIVSLFVMSGKTVTK